MSIPARPQWELAAVAKRDQYNKLLQFPQPPLDIPWGANARAVNPSSALVQSNGRGLEIK